MGARGVARLGRRRAGRLALLAALAPGAALGAVAVRDDVGEPAPARPSPVAAARPLHDRQPLALSLPEALAAPPAAPAPLAEPALAVGAPGVEVPPPEPRPQPTAAAGRAATAAPAGDPRGRGVWALVVGINDYPGVDADLRNAVNDGLEVLRLLDRMGSPEVQRRVLFEHEATAENIAAGLDWLVANAGPAATAVVFYAGHVRKVAPGQESIVGADSRDLADTEVARRLSGLQAERSWLIVAACYAEGFDEAMAAGRILTGASGRDALAYEDPRMGRSYLVEYMIRRAILQGRASESVEQAFAWAVEALRRDRPDRLPVQHDAVPGHFPIGGEDADRNCSALPLVTVCNGRDE